MDLDLETGFETRPSLRFDYYLHLLYFDVDMANERQNKSFRRIRFAF